MLHWYCVTKPDHKGITADYFSVHIWKDQKLEPLEKGKEKLNGVKNVQLY